MDKNWNTASLFVNLASITGNIIYNVGQTTISHPQITINSWYKFPNGWSYGIVLTT